MGWSPLPAGTMKKEHDRLIGRYGRTYLDDYGWADGLIEPPLTFAGLEAKADLNYCSTCTSPGATSSTPARTA